MDSCNRLLVIRSASRRLAAALLPVAFGILAAAPAQALTWTNIQCAGGLECPPAGTPPFACDCGLYADSPASLVANGETAFLFVASGALEGAVDETAIWRAPAPAGDYSAYSKLKVRGGANDSGDLKVLLFKNTAGNGFLTCNDSVVPLINPDLLAIIEWGGASVNPDDSVLTVEQVSPIAIAANDTLGICIILTDDPDNAAPVSGRTSGQIDYIQLVTNNGFVKTLEDFKVAN